MGTVRECLVCAAAETKKASIARNASVVIDRGDKEDCCCVQKKADIGLQEFLPL